MSRSRTHHSPARRVLAVCALTGAALMATLSGGQAWADAAPKPVAPGVVAPNAEASPKTAMPTPSAPKPEASPAVAVPKGVVSPVPVAPAGGQPPQVREVPKGAAQAGDGSTASDGSGLMLAGGGTVAAVGAAALGFAVLRRRSGARG